MGASVAQHIPEGVIERLPSYLSVLIQLRQEGCYTVSSARLGELTDVNPAQIRRDLTHFGSFGKRGVGYEIVTLIDRIQRILGSDHTHRLALIGAGHLGSAIAAYNGLRARGFVVSAIFDNDIAKVGTRIGDLVVQDISRFDRVVREQKIQIGVIAVPPAEAQSVSDLMVESGIKVILNYSPAMVRVADDVTLHNTDPVRELLHTLYYLSRTESVAQVQA
ncbi:MAG: redox-sensing transcriptional repressor Rex [Coriobacteriia bacterium]|nr:redox-sensing transcriptional repressor Rex [Coriobacteriia bacterium]